MPRKPTHPIIEKDGKTYKICTVCNETKETTEFYPNYEYKDRRLKIMGRCKSCSNKLTIKWQKDNPEREKIIKEKASTNKLKKIKYARLCNRMSQYVHHLYDIILDSEVFIPASCVKKWCKQNHINYCGILQLNKGRQKHVGARYILPQNKHKLFILVDFESGKTYRCITDMSLLLHLGLPVNQTNSDAINRMQTIKGKARSNYVSILGRLYSLIETTKLPSTKTKSEHLPKLQKLRQDILLKEHITERLRNRLRSAIRDQKKLKTNIIGKIDNLIGCSIEFFFEYMATKFTQGMSWDNYGAGKDKWNIDHIIPCIAFDLDNPTEQKKCFHYTNLQPLWHIENSRKGCRYTPPRAPAIQLI
jgi:hypothetical protein